MKILYVTGKIKIVNSSDIFFPFFCRLFCKMINSSDFVFSSLSRKDHDGEQF